ncbi:MAG: hypothetical protein JXA54_00130 [Candidatus Heimdallarchaeota archaeon]|nr:hypothetical protein [Candidatus Heimdallarchaeota archaeon]
MNRKEEVRFLLTDLDYKFQEEDDLPVIRLFGKSNDTQILVHVHGFAPYLYIKKSPEIVFILQNDPTINRWQKGSTEVTLRRYFWAGEQVKLVKLFGKDPVKIKDISRELEKLGLETFESDIPFLKRFLIDNDIKCLNVISVKATRIERKDKQVFAEVNFEDIEAVNESEIASPILYYLLKIMSINIKIARENESVQELWQKKNRAIISITLIWGTSAKPENGKLILLEEDSEDGEKRLLLEFIRILHEVQPDILCTYQGDSFDLPYLFHRMYVLQVPTHLLSLFKDDACFYSPQLLSYRIKGRMCFDLALRTWGIHPSSGKKGLYDISQETLGRGKPTTETIANTYQENTPEHGEVLAESQFWSLWREWIDNGKKDSLSKLAKRCFYDAKLIYDLYWSLGMTGWIETLRVTGFPPAESNSCTERLNGEFELMRYMRRKGILIPKRPDKEQVEKNRVIRELYPHEGGTVLYPVGSLHTGVLIADFRSMYPSVMIAQNIGGETLKQWIQASDYGDPKKLFDKQSRSCLAIMEETLINKRIFKKSEIKRLTELFSKEPDNEKRRAIKDTIETLEREQNSMKIVANSMYGAHFYIRSRFYTQTLASAISDSARSYLLGIEEDLAEISKTIIPCELIYGDTDSTFIKINDENLFTKIFAELNLERKEELTAKLMRVVNVIIKKLNDRLPNPLELKFEDIAYRIIFKPNRKKAYSYVSLLNDDFKVKGFEAVRSDWSPISRSAQRKVLEILLRHSKNTSERESEFQIARRFLINLGVKILQMPIEELVPKVVILTPIRRAPEAYKAKTPAVEAFRHFAKMEQLDSDKEWMDYDKFPWIITAGEGPIYNRARHPKFVDNIDREHYVREMLRCCEDLGVKVSLKEVQGALPTGRLHHLFEKVTKENSFNSEGIDISGYHKQTNKQQAVEVTIIEPVKEGELGWRNKVKGIRRNVIRQKAADQTLLNLFSEPSDEETSK